MDCLLLQQPPMIPKSICHDEILLKKFKVSITLVMKTVLILNVWKPGAAFPPADPERSGMLPVARSPEIRNLPPLAELPAMHEALPLQAPPQRQEMLPLPESMAGQEGLMVAGSQDNMGGLLMAGIPGRQEAAGSLGNRDGLQLPGSPGNSNGLPLPGSSESQNVLPLVGSPGSQLMLPLVGSPGVNEGPVLQSAGSLERKEVFFLQEFEPETQKEKIKLAIVTKWMDERLLDCKFFISEDVIAELLRSTKDHRIQRAEDNETQKLLDVCFQMWEVGDDQPSRDPHSPSTDQLTPRFLDYRTKHLAAGNAMVYRSLSDGNDTERDEEDGSLHGAASFFETDLDPSDMRDAMRMLGSSRGPVPNATEGLFGDNNLIYPGTKWCGPGKDAKDFDDLGYFKKTDECCRTHDQCEDKIAPGESKYDLENTSPYHKLNCKCDDEFFDCLTASDSHTSNIIGNLYFDIFKRECFDFDHPRVYKCITHETFLRIVCDAYERNTGATKTYYWRKAKEYKKIPFSQLYTEILSHYKHFNHFSLFKVTS